MLNLRLLFSAFDQKCGILVERAGVYFARLATSQRAVSQKPIKLKYAAHRKATHEGFDSRRLF